MISFLSIALATGQRWCTPLISGLGRQRWVDSVFQASLVYKMSSRAARAIQRNHVMKSKQTNKKEKTKKQQQKKSCADHSVYLQQYKL